MRFFCLNQIFKYQYVHFNTSTNKFSGVESGTAELVAEHKTTGIRRTFSIKVNKNAIIIIPGFLGSALYVGADNPYFTEGMPMFSADIINGLSTYQYGDTVEDLIPNIWWEYIANIPSAINLFQSWYDSMRCNDDGTSKYEITVKEFRSKDASTLSIDPENLLPPEKMTVTGGRIIRSRSILVLNK